MTITRLGACLVIAGCWLTPAAAGTDAYIGEIMMTGVSFCPQGWVDAEGQMLQVASYGPLYSLYGTTYGGNGTTTFGVPDLRGRIPLGQGGPGRPHPQGEAGGVENVTLTVANLPVHSHALMASTAPPNTGTPAGNYLAQFPAALAYTTTAPSAAARPAQLASASVAAAGSSQPFYNMQPYLSVRFCIATTGVFPQR